MTLIKQVVEQALQAGHHVTAIVRNPGDFVIQHKNLKIINGDVLQPLIFCNIMKEKDVVVSCLDVKHKKPTTVYSKGVDNIIQFELDSHPSTVA